jgi:hypothetical protein
VNRHVGSVGSHNTAHNLSHTSNHTNITNHSPAHQATGNHLPASHHTSMPKVGGGFKGKGK